MTQQQAEKYLPTLYVIGHFACTSVFSPPRTSRHLQHKIIMESTLIWASLIKQFVIQSFCSFLTHNHIRQFCYVGSSIPRQLTCTCISSALGFRQLKTRTFRQTPWRRFVLGIGIRFPIKTRVFMMNAIEKTKHWISACCLALQASDPIYSYTGTPTRLGWRDTDISLHRKTKFQSRWKSPKWRLMTKAV